MHTQTSNTGQRYITETVKWRQYRPQCCFWVTVPTGERVSRRLDGKGWRKRNICRAVRYGPRSRTREQALKIAKRLRDELIKGL